MRTLPLGNTGVQVSSLCLGTHNFGAHPDDATCNKMLDIYYEAGGRFLDTANIYNMWHVGHSGGESEAFIGRWMKERGIRDQIVVATKMGIARKNSDDGLRAHQIARECELSLKQLQSDYIDIYLAHRDDYDTPQEETMEAFHKLVKAGKVRFLGASSFFSWRIANANAVARERGWTPFINTQQHFTYLPQLTSLPPNYGPRVSEDLLHLCRFNKIALTVFTPLLNGAYTRTDKPIKEDHRVPDMQDRLDVLNQIARETGCTVNQVVLAWMNQFDPPIIPIFTASRPEQVAENVGAWKLTLTPDQMTRLNTAWAKGKPTTT